MKRDFQAYDYNTSYNKILPYFENDTDYRGIMLLVVGANGSGKTTYIANFLDSYELDIKYINADMIEKEMLSDIGDDNERAEKSMELTLKMLKRALKKKQSIVYESVFSHPSKLEIVKKARDMGYKIIAIHVKTNDPEINIERVAKRVSQGGHDVPKDKILSRYERVQKNVKALKDIVDDFSEFDNSKELPIISINEENDA